MQDTFTLRAARSSAEFYVAAEFWGAMYEEAGILNTADFVKDWRERYVAYFEQRVAQGEARIIVAIDQEHIVGTAGALLADGYPAAIHGLRFGYIFGVRVDPAYRGKGLATALTRETIAFLQSLNCRRIRLHASNMGRPIYERLGFVATNEMGLA